MGSKLGSSLVKENNKYPVPGPGNYQPETKYHSQFKYDGHTKFGSSVRAGIYDERRAKFVPSPFAYK